MKVFVTGAGGFLGFAIAKQLLEKNYQVVSYSRGKYKALENLDIIHHQGCLSDYGRLSEAMKSCEAVFHVASKVGNWGSYTSFYEANVVGTRHIIKACYNLQIPYLVYTSSPSVVFDGNAEGKNENMPYPARFDSYYSETKAICRAGCYQSQWPRLNHLLPSSSPDMGSQ
jgi:nucleoside-diphosphate-sugar epimerase